MRVLPTVHEMGYMLVPALIVVASAYIWIAGKLQRSERPTTIQRRIDRAA